MIFKKLFLLLSVFLLLYSCQRDETPLTPADNESPPAYSASESQMIEINNRFSFELLRRINEAKKDSNVFISPFSVSMALSMALNGADGQTYDEIRAVLGFADFPQDSVNKLYRSLYLKLQGLDPKVLFEIANSIWYRTGFEVLNSFIEVNQNYFAAEVAELDFSDPAALLTINGWVKEKTHGKIEKILERIPRDAVMYILNALYFKGTWKYAFDPQYTRDHDFIKSPQETVPCKMMYLTANLQYYQDENLQTVELPYGDGSFRMLVVLPASDKNIDTFIASLNQTKWEELLSGGEIDSGTVGLPKFKFSFDMLLNNTLSDMGMPAAFNANSADFSRITPQGGIWISMVKHKTFVEVNEEGTEAAAVTIVGFERTASDIFNMIVNRPFLFVIYEKNSGAVLFMGKIADPVYAQD
ncbi:MAG: serpin family protein [Calditrichaeota bacterium]|nr:serpin family protein [Calditrichota bacterium]